jgi:hypothetical protein
LFLIALSFYFCYIVKESKIQKRGVCDMKLKSVLFIFLAFLLVFGGCKEEEEGDESSNVYYYGGTSSPGDVWEWELNHSDKTFVGNFKESGHEFSISGSYVDLAYGFKKGTVNEVNNTSGTSDVPSPGDTGYFVEVPGLALAIHPNDDDSHSISYEPVP